jgi:hypothetical protein
MYQKIQESWDSYKYRIRNKPYWEERDRKREKAIESLIEVIKSEIEPLSQDVAQLCTEYARTDFERNQNNLERLTNLIMMAKHQRNQYAWDNTGLYSARADFSIFTCTSQDVHFAGEHQLVQALSPFVDQTGISYAEKTRMTTEFLNSFQKAFQPNEVSQSTSQSTPAPKRK